MKTSSAKTAILSALISLIPCIAFAQGFESERIARFITAEDGLTNNFIEDLLVDDAGFLWAATYILRLMILRRQRRNSRVDTMEAIKVVDQQSLQ